MWTVYIVVAVVLLVLGLVFAIGVAARDAVDPHKHTWEAFEWFIAILISVAIAGFWPLMLPLGVLGLLGSTIYRTAKAFFMNRE